MTRIKRIVNGTNARANINVILTSGMVGIPEGRMVCPQCESKYLKEEKKWQ